MEKKYENGDQLSAVSRQPSALSRQPRTKDQPPTTVN